MKQFLFVTLTLLLSINLQAEEPDPLSFFPHQVGDSWTYKFYHGKVSKTTVTEVWTENGIDTNIRLDGLGGNYKLNTNLSVFSGSGGKLYYQLDAEEGETWTVRPANEETGDPRIEAYLEDTYETILFGKWATVKQIAYFYLYNGDTTIHGSSAMYTHTQWLASGIGLVQEIGEGSSEMEFVLTGCVINGDTLGVVTDVQEQYQPSLPIQVIAFPNPCSLFVTIRYNPLSGNQQSQIELVDILGKSVYTATSQSNFHTINTSLLPKGIYFCRVMSGTNTTTTTIAVQR